MTTAVQFDGLLGPLALWKSDIGHSGFARLARGVSPRWIDPASLVAYWRLAGGHSPEIDEISGKHATLTGSLPAALDPPLWMPGRPRWQRLFEPPAPLPSEILSRRGQAFRAGSRGVWRE